MERLCPVGGNLKCGGCCGKQRGDPSKIKNPTFLILEVSPPYDTIISLPGIHPNENRVSKNFGEMTSARKQEKVPPADGDQNLTE